MITKRKIYSFVALTPLILAVAFYHNRMTSIFEAMIWICSVYILMIPALLFFFLLVNSNSSAPTSGSNGTHSGPDLYINTDTYEIGAFNDGGSVKINNF